MKRWTIRICVLLLLGAIVNLQVAWGFAALTSPDGGAFRRGVCRIEADLYWSTQLSEQPGKTRCSTRVFFDSTPRQAHKDTPEELIPAWGRADRPVPPEPRYEPNSQTGRTERLITPVFMQVVDEALGWPALAMKCGWGSAELSEDTRVYSWPPEADAWSIVIEPIGKMGRGGKSLPLQPIWPGFAINTLFYAAILWLLFAAPATIRRWRRIRRGQCPACAYPVGSSDVCTECGAELKQKAETQKAEITT